MLNWKLRLQEQFGDTIIDAKETTIDSLFVLDITVKHTDLSKVNAVSSFINDWLNTQNIERFDSICVHSPGISLDYSLTELHNHVGEEILIKLHKNENKVNEYKATLLEVFEDAILLRWNQKGNIRKIKLAKSNIASVQKYVKF
ncbi:ribosome assembly cofactor RimP [Mycoplasmopsis phocirhinis]|uniref:Ribosome assembly cofactor RimP n=1 Tax=Mycoplasmopsis phocirhinis TaxID=142650 RepID=A0A4P6MRS2_9BACT|nr:ribosome assembly cofactor RimP [Mycoplasmopsis phocirhinis]QBF34344.1 ribosome assembly cofactor RimP [Mycoplasmopsis phocirhinis]